jgi:hypothetical protein
MKRWYLDAPEACGPDRRTRRDLIWECAAPRHQLAVLKRCRTRRPCFRPIDRLFWVFLSWRWPDWREALIIIQADTVLRWRRDDISVIWKYRSRGRRRGGRPRAALETRQLIHEMARANFLWGAPRIHGELLKLGISVSQATVSRYMPVSHGGRRSQTWRAFIQNQATAIVRNRTSEGGGWIANIRSWLRLVRHRAATFAATALAVRPSSRTWYLAHARSLIATHQRARVARNETLSVASAFAVARRLTPSSCTVDPLTAGRIRGPPRCAHTQSASCFRHRSNGSALHVLHGRVTVRRRLPAIFRPMCKIAGHQIANRDQPTHYVLEVLPLSS